MCHGMPVPSRMMIECSFELGSCPHMCEGMDTGMGSNPFRYGIPMALLLDQIGHRACILTKIDRQGPRTNPALQPNGSSPVRALSHARRHVEATSSQKTLVLVFME